MEASKKEHDMIVDRAGMSSQFPGQSETKLKFKDFDPSVYKAEKFSSSITSSTLQNHQLRVKKLQDPANYKVTGESETSVRFVPYQPEDYVRVVLTRNDRAHTKILPPSKFEGHSEYTVIYARMNECNPPKETKLSINPYKNIEIASKGRPNEMNTMFTPEVIKDSYTTHTKLMHQWPLPEDNRRFDWMQNKRI